MTHAPTDRQLLDRLKRLIDSAAAKVARWEGQNPEATAGDREKYRDWCHRQVWGKFQDLASRLDMTVDGYSTGGGTYEEEMKKFYDAYNEAWEEGETGWWGNIDDGWLISDIDGEEPTDV